MILLFKLWTHFSRIIQFFCGNVSESFWKIEAKAWRKLYEEQRGGEAFNKLQQELITERRKNYVQKT